MLRTCEKIRKRRTRAERRYGKAHARAHPPQRAVTERATRPDGLSCSRPQGCVSFGLTCVARADSRAKGDSLSKRPQGDAKHRQHRCGYCRRPHAWQAKNPAATRHFVIFSQVLREFRLCGSPLTKAGKARNRRILIGPATRQALSNAPGLWRRIRCSDILSVVADMRLWLWRVAGL